MKHWLGYIFGLIVAAIAMPLGHHTDFVLSAALIYGLILIVFRIIWTHIDEG